MKENSKRSEKIRRAKKCDKNIRTVYESTEKVIKLFDDYSRIVPEDKFLLGMEGGARMGGLVL